MGKKRRTSRAPSSGLAKHEKKLLSSAFRVVNEQVYKATAEGGDAPRVSHKAKGKRGQKQPQRATQPSAAPGGTSSTFSSSAVTFGVPPSEFSLYHAGFEAQRKKWPRPYPLDVLVSRVLDEWDELAKVSKVVRVVDAGAGVGELGRNLTKEVERAHGKGKVVVHSYDSVATPPWVAVGNSAALPEASGSQDVMTFCLSLMGTNWTSYIIEAFRVLRRGGLLLIAEVTSRLQAGEEGRATLINRFRDLGFVVQGEDFSPNPFFTAWAFIKAERRERPRVLDTDQDLLKPCIYKRR